MFDSCPAYQDFRPEVLFLSHCVPNPPDKGEKIRAFHEVAFLAERCRLHLACLARSEPEMRDAEALAAQCASVYVERLAPRAALARAAMRFARGGCLNRAYFSSRRLREHVAGLAGSVRLEATVVYTAVMSPYAPAGVPILLDMVDVDSEKWFQYSRTRRPGCLYAMEARRLRRFEEQCARAAQFTVLTTENDADLLKRIARGAAIGHMENGVDGEFFDGHARPMPIGLRGRPFVTFVGTMDYHPNAQGAAWFAGRVFPELRRRVPDLEFFIVGRNVSAAVVRLERHKGVRVVGAVPDVRPYLAGARAIVAPLETARGIQNKVLEGLAMGRPVFASEAVCRTFGSSLPRGVVRCESERDYVEALEPACRIEPRCDEAIRRAACSRFSWKSNLDRLASGQECLNRQPAGAAAGQRTA